MDEQLITGYQFGPQRGEFRGTYEFPRNKDKKTIHLPPLTTLETPPPDIPEGKEARWNGEIWLVLPIPAESVV